MSNSDPISLDRRTLLGAAGLGLLPSFAGAAHIPGGDAGFVDSPDLKDPWMRDPKKTFINFFLRCRAEIK